MTETPRPDPWADVARWSVTGTYVERMRVKFAGSSMGARVFGALEEEFCLNWDEGAPLQACLNRVSSVAAKTKLHRWWLHWKGLDDVSSVPAEGDR